MGKKRASDQERDPWKLFLADVQRRPMIPHDRLLELFKLYHAGDMAARDQIADANLRLVVSYALKWRASGVEVLDLVQMGSLGLLKAIEKFRPELGYRFSTYASWWIRQSIQRNVANTADTIRIPIHAQREARAAGVAHPRTVQSIDDPVNVEGDVFLRDLLEDDGESSETILARDQLQALVHSVLDQMDEMESVDSRETEVLRLRFGLGTDEPQTLDDVGELLDVSRERIRQIETSAKANFKRQLRLTSPRLFEAVKRALGFSD